MYNKLIIFFALVKPLTYVEKPDTVNYVIDKICQKERINQKSEKVKKSTALESARQRPLAKRCLNVVETKKEKSFLFNYVI